MEIVASWPAASSLADVAAWARRAEAAGFDVMHVPETIHDPFTVAALALTATERLVVRTSMVVAFPRSPMLTAVAAWDLARLSGGRFQLGVASQVRGNIVGRYSTSWSDPVERLRDYVASIRAIWHTFSTGGPLDHVGPVYRFTKLQPYFNPGPLDCADPAIWTGGVKAGMVRLAGEVADGFVAHPTNSHPRVLTQVTAPALEAGRVRGARAHGPRVVAGPQPVTAATEAEVARALAGRREELAFLYSTPAYRGQLELFGLEHVGERLSAMAAAAQWDDLGTVLTDEVVRLLVPTATFEDLPDLLEQWYAGVCEGLVLQLPQADDPDQVIDLVRALAAIPSR